MTQQSEVVNNEKYIPVLNAGFVGLVDYMGNDSSIVQAARVSYGKGTKKISEDRGLIRYLVRHSHTTPLEMVEFKFHCKMPIFVARQWIRHRTASVNEYSGRYSEMSEDMFIPELDTIQFQSNINKQGRSDEFVDNTIKESVQNCISEKNVLDQKVYKDLMNHNIAKEMARGVLSVNNYTEWYWKIDLHNLFHFLKLRLDEHAQHEIRVFAEAMYKLIKPIVPLACEAFEDYIFDIEDGNYQNYKLSKQELQILRDILNKSGLSVNKDIEDKMRNQKISQREIDEFKRKLKL